jgi:biotin synthase-related radical SAM superfamily protein
VREVFDRYERALTENDIASLKELFWDNAMTLRYGEAENLHGADQIHAFGRRVHPGRGPATSPLCASQRSGRILPLPMLRRGSAP